MQSYVQRAKKQAASPDIIQAVRSSGRPRAIPEPIREKMGASLGMDFSSVKIYESPLVGEQGAQAAAMGNEIAFAPGKFNMGSFSGQALLGHELAHIGQQARGEVSGGGLVRNSSFEHQADVQGMMAARGETAVSPASSAQIAPMSAAPIQARESKSERKARSRQVSAWKAGMQQQYEQEGALWAARADADPADQTARYRANSFGPAADKTTGEMADTLAKVDPISLGIKTRTDAFKAAHPGYTIGGTTNRDMVRFLTSHAQRDQAVAAGDETMGVSDQQMEAALQAENATSQALADLNRAKRAGNAEEEARLSQHAATSGMPLVGMVGQSVADLQAEMAQLEGAHNKPILSTDDAAMRYAQTSELYKKAQITRDIASLLNRSGTAQALPEERARQFEAQYHYAVDICEYVKALLGYANSGQRSKEGDRSQKAIFEENESNLGGKGNANFANFMAGRTQARRRRAAGN